MIHTLIEKQHKRWLHFHLSVQVGSFFGLVSVWSFGPLIKKVKSKRVSLKVPHLDSSSFSNLKIVKRTMNIKVPNLPLWKNGFPKIGIGSIGLFYCLTFHVLQSFLYKNIRKENSNPFFPSKVMIGTRLYILYSHFSKVREWRLQNFWIHV